MTNRFTSQPFILRNIKMIPLLIYPVLFVVNCLIIYLYSIVEDTIPVLIIIIMGIILLSMRIKENRFHNTIILFVVTTIYSLMFFVVNFDDLWVIILLGIVTALGLIVASEVFLFETKEENMLLLPAVTVNEPAESPFVTVNEPAEKPAESPFVTVNEPAEKPAESPFVTVNEPAEKSDELSEEPPIRRAKRAVKFCSVCGKSYFPKGRQVYCSPECKAANAKNRKPT
jgi:hypothetical protein